MRKIHPSRKNGQSLVELALILPLLLLISVVTIDLGRGVFYYSVIYNAAREGARYGVVHQQPDNTMVVDSDGILEAARSKAAGMDRNEIKYPRAGGGDQLPIITGNLLTVTVEYKFTLITPFYTWFTGSKQFTLNSSSTMLIER